ncbi:MAG: hypothetical protein KAU90_04405 [Sulfurovaceae bacterium]|nr:hypothetical protein [Sulfurovaceae bacterium]
MNKNIIKMMLTVSVIFGLSACGEPSDKDKNGTTPIDMLNGATEDLGDTNPSSDMNASSILDQDGIKNSFPEINATNSSGTSDINKSSAIPKPDIGHYFDSAVKGVDYKCGDFNGTTDNNGTFQYEKDKDCLLTLGNDLVLQELNSSELSKYKGIIVEKNVSKARFLQTLDSDGNASNGIDIIDSVKKRIADMNVSNVLVDDALTKFQDGLVGTDGYNGDLIDIDKAKSHLVDTIKNLQDDGEDVVGNGDLNMTKNDIYDMFGSLI